MQLELIQDFNDDTFDDQLAAAGKPVLLDFWAPWCAPCRALSPLLNELAKAYEGELVIAKINIDQNPKLRERFAVRSIPNLRLLKDGVEYSPNSINTKSRLSAFLDTHL